METLVIGGGVSGLSTGIALLEAGHSVRLWARDLPPHTTSNVAAAVWYPYRAWPVDRVAAWGAQTYRAFMGLVAEPSAGVILREVVELRGTPTPEDPWWRGGVAGFRRLSASELGNGYEDGWAFQAPVIDTTVYLDYLVARFTGLGGQIERRTVASLAEALAVCDRVANCTGLGARELVGDASLRAARGQVLRLPGVAFDRVVLDDFGPQAVAYIVPRTHDLILGGTDVEGDERLEGDAADTRSIVTRCAAMVEGLDPTFAAQLRDLLAPDGRVTPQVEVKVGLRPIRDEVRLEAEQVIPGKRVVHNYGHGGAGVTLSWGCAQEAAQLLIA